MFGNVKRGEIYIANLGEKDGSVQAGIRPVLIIQNDIGNKYSPTVIIAPLTTKRRLKSFLPTHFFINNSCGLKQSILMAEQIQTINKILLHKYICKLDDEQMENIDKTIKISLGLE